MSEISHHSHVVMSEKCTKKSDEQAVLFAYETSCLFGDLVVIAIAFAKSPWSTCKDAFYQELWLHSILI